MACAGFVTALPASVPAAAPVAASSQLCQLRPAGARSTTHEIARGRTFLYGTSSMSIGRPRFSARRSVFPVRVVASGEDAPSDIEDESGSSYFKPRHAAPVQQAPPELPSASAKAVLLEEISTGNGGLGASAAKRSAVEEAVAELLQTHPEAFPLDQMSTLTGKWRFAWTSDRRILAGLRLLESAKALGVQSNDVLLDIDGASMRAEGLVSFRLPYGGVKVETRVGVDYRKETSKRLEEAYSTLALISNLGSEDGIKVPETLPGGAQLSQIAGAFLGTAGALLRKLEVPLEGRYKRQIVVLYADEDTIVSRAQDGSLDVLVKVSDETSVGSREVSTTDAPRSVEIPIDYDS